MDNTLCVGVAQLAGGGIAKQCAGPSLAGGSRIRHQQRFRDPRTVQPGHEPAKPLCAEVTGNIPEHVELRETVRRRHPPVVRPARMLFCRDSGHVVLAEHHLTVLETAGQIGELEDCGQWPSFLSCTKIIDGTAHDAHAVLELNF